jgi:hypothetical protein
MTPLEPDRPQIKLFVDALFKHAVAQSFVSLRSFYDASNAIAKVASLIIRLFPFRLCLATLGVAFGSTPFG